MKEIKYNLLIAVGLIESWISSGCFLTHGLFSKDILCSIQLLGADLGGMLTISFY